jgi:hypothetical protein
MTTPSAQPFNVAGEGSQVGVQAQQAYVDSITLPGDVQLTVGLDASPQAKYQAGVENLKSGNAGQARTLIWDAMMGDYGGSEVLFHWLVAMLSGRTVRQFSKEEIDQLKRSRSRYTGAAGNDWADGVSLIYRLLDSLLPSLTAGPKAAKADMSLLVKQFEDLGERQRDMVRPHLELFLTGPIKNEMWQQELQDAQDRQHASGRRGRAWMFFQPVPAKVLLPPPEPESVRTVDRFGMCASAVVFVAAAGYLGWELLWHLAFFGLLALVAALAGGTIAAVADLESRSLTERCRRKEELFRVPIQSTVSPPTSEGAGGVDRLFKRYFGRYEKDKAQRERWEAATAGIRRFYRDEIVAVCRTGGIPANEVAWLVRFEVRDLKRRWQDGTLHEYRRLLVPRRRTLAVRWAGLAALALGGVWAVVTLRAYPLADAAALASALWAWRCWLRVNLERARHAADRDEHARRQAAVDEEFGQWSRRLEARPKDADMATWLACDRTVLLGRALDHFRLPRSRLNAHAFLEEPGVAVRRSRIEGGPWRYAGYRLLVFLLAEDGVRQVRASLDFMTGTLTIRERTSYRYEAIVSMHVSRETRRHTFELRLAAGEPIIVRVRDADPSAAPDQDTGPAEETREAADAEDDAGLDVSSVADLLHALEGVAGEGRNWFQAPEWAGIWSDDEADQGVRASP